MLGGYILLFPRAKVVTVIFIVFFFTILELPALLVLGIWFLQQAVMGYFDLAQPAGQGGGVAYFAHIGGFVFGLLAVRLFASRKRTARRRALRPPLMSQRVVQGGRSDAPPALAVRLLMLIVLAARRRRGLGGLPARRRRRTPRDREGPAEPAAGVGDRAAGRRRHVALAARRAARSARRQRRIDFKKPPRSALLFDLDTGKVLYRRDPTRVLPIASLTKMMTALRGGRAGAGGLKVRITNESLRYTGSGVGVLPRGKWIGINTMLHGLLLPSGNDAAIALAQRAAGGSEKRFIRYMNEKAKELGLVCTHFSTPSGIKDEGNHSCAGDLAAIARAVLREPRLARIVKRKQAILPFPIKGGRLWLYNHNPLLRANYPGTTGLKTGYTDAAGRCLVATARRGPIKLGVVLLHSPDPGKQAMQLLDRGFKASTGT